MRRAALYSSSVKRQAVITGETPATVASAPPPAFFRWRRAIETYRLYLSVLAGVLAVFAGMSLEYHLADRPARVTQQDIDRAVRLSLEKQPLPSQAAKAFEAIRPSVVRVVGFNHPDPALTLPKAGTALKPQDKSDDEKVAVGTGVVITEKGAILTNLHVVSGVKHILVMFDDGTKSAAMIKGADPGNDLAVLQATTLPDDLQPATLISTADLKQGDEVVAVGFPFGFGPSVSSGVVSGLKREFHSSDGKNVLGNLIQFDAAVNPGNSGGPLVNMEGEVLGIVTAIFNPVKQHFFVGLGFAVPIENAALAVGVPPF